VENCKSLKIYFAFSAPKSVELAKKIGIYGANMGTKLLMMVTVIRNLSHIQLRSAKYKHVLGNGILVNGVHAITVRRLLKE